MTTAKMLRPGYQVSLKSSAVLMTVLKVDENSGQVTVVWHLETGEMQRATVPAQTLRLREKS